MKDKEYIKKIFIELGILSLFIFPALVLAQTQISVGIPGNLPNSTSTAPGAFVANFYQFAIFIGGILAFGVVVYGGVRYMASAGNPSGQSDAKEWIWGALIGLALLAGAYLVLNVVNPQLTNLTLPNLSQISSQNANGTSGGTATTNGACQSNSCQSGSTCWATNTNGTVTHTCTSGGPGPSATTCVAGQTNTSPCLCPSGSQANSVQESSNGGKVNVYTCP
jgi:hypothetical protein